MELADFVIPREKVLLPGKAKDGERPHFMVRGLCADDLTFLVQLHLDPISKAVKLYQESRFDVLSTGNMQSFIMLLARDFPGLVAEVISAAADALDDKTRGVARKLPITVQLAALTAILRLTMEDAGGLKNLLAEMRERLQAVASVASGESEHPLPPKTV